MKNRGGSPPFHTAKPWEAFTPPDGHDGLSEALRRPLRQTSLPLFLPLSLPLFSSFSFFFSGSGMFFFFSGCNQRMPARQDSESHLGFRPLLLLKRSEGEGKRWISHWRWRLSEMRDGQKMG